MEWYYAKNGQQLGPVSQETLIELYRGGTIQGTDLVWNETMSEWAPLGTVPGLAVPPPVLSASPASPPLQTSAAPAGGPVVLTSSLPYGQPAPPTYLWQSIVCVIICCWPFAIPAIVFGTKVKPAMEAGDYGAALEASKKAKMWCLISFIVGIIVQCIILLLSVVVGNAESMGSQ